MRRDRILLIAAVVLVGILMAPLADSDGARPGDQEEEPPAPMEITVYGYVSNLSFAEGNVPLQGVVVSLLDAEKSPIGEPFTTGEDGRFEFTFLDTDGATYLKFDCQGYTVRTLPASMSDLGEEVNTVLFMLDQVTPDEEGKYPLSGSGDSRTAVGMALTSGTIFGSIVMDDTGGGIEGATVRAIAENGQEHTATTNENGYFQFNDLPYGDYTILVSCSGFQNSEAVTANTYDQQSVTIELHKNEFGLGMFGGLDMPHTMMILGLILIGLVLLFSLVSIRKAKVQESSIVVVNDLDLEGEEDDVGRP